jgi:hypothetical protein
MPADECPSRLRPARPLLPARRPRRLLLLALLLALPTGEGCRRGGEGGPAVGGAAVEADECACHGREALRVGTAADWTLVHADYDYACGLRGSGTLWCWGDNAAGRLGDGSEEGRPTPLRIGERADWRGLALADFFTCGWTADGQILCWGGHLGAAVVYPPRVVSPRPEPVAFRELREGRWTRGAGPGAPLTLVSMHLGDGHGCGLDAEGAAWCWAGPAPERCGRDAPPAFPDRSGPGDGLAMRVDVGGLDPPPRFLDLTVGSRHACGRTEDGRVLCWGGNADGQVGVDGGDELVETPTPVDLGALPEGTRFAEVDAGVFHTCALTAEGAAYCWGDGRGGGLGTGDTLDRAVPVPVDVSGLPAGTRFASISAGRAETCALTPDGTAICWGGCKEEREGHAPACLAPRPVPAPPGGGEWRFRTVSVGTGFVCGVTLAGALYCWGRNHKGQCGVGAASFETSFPPAVQPASR